MVKLDEKSFDFLIGREADYTRSVMNELANAPWAKALIDDINATGGLTGENKAKLFELRFGYSLHKAGIVPRYETPGEGQSTLDYGITSGGRVFLVEMMRLEETDAVRAATTTQTFADGAVMAARRLGTNAEDERQSEEGETLKAVQRICQKFESGGKPHKFSAPGTATHVLLVDFRTFLNRGGDEHDRVHVGLGGELVPNEARRRYWKGNLISGVFSPKTNVRGRSPRTAALHRIRKRAILRDGRVRAVNPIHCQSAPVQNFGGSPRRIGGLAARRTQHPERHKSPGSSLKARK
jgi:hypothetical protein